jgi:hypothetical protein
MQNDVTCHRKVSQLLRSEVNPTGSSLAIGFEIVLAGGEKK